MPSSVLDRYNKVLKDLAGEENGKGTSHGEKTDPLARYRQAYQEGDTLAVIFDTADKDGSLSYTDENGIQVYINVKDLMKAMPYYGKDISGRMIGKKFTAKIRSIDAKAGVVHVVGTATKTSTKRKIESEIKKALKEGEHPSVMGRIIRLNDKTAYVDILGRGLLGICNVAYWRHTFVSSLRDEAKVGDLLEFQVTDVNKMRPDSKIANSLHIHSDSVYILSRVELSDDPWKNIPDNLTVGTAILVRCTERPEGKTFWWGTTNVAPGLQVMCDYNPRLKIMQDRTYKCNIFRLDREAHKFQASPFEMTDIGIGKDAEKNLEILTNNEILK